MKTLHLAIIIFSALGILIVTNPVYAPCPVGVTDCGPPPGVTVSTWTDSQSYERNDTIDLKGKLYVENYTNPVSVQVINPTSMVVQTLETFVNNNTFSAKINANFSENGMYQIVTCVKSWCDRSYFTYTGEPYALSFNGANYPVWYKSVANVGNMSVNTSEDSLLIHLSGAPIGSIFQISLPRNLIDSVSTNGADYNFTVFAGEDPVQKLMSKANFNQTQTSQIARTLEIKIPSYSQIADMQGEMYVKIIGTKTSDISDMVTLSPLQQFKSGITVTEVTCATNYVLTIKSEDGSPACVKPSTVRILTERGWAKFESAQTNHASNAKTNPFGIAGLIIYYGGGPCGAGVCPLNTFNLKITSNYTAYLLGYNICDGNICTKNDNMEILLPISNVSFPNFKTIALPEDLNWKYKDTIHIQVMASAFPENETAVSIDLGNSTTFQ